MTYRFSFDRFFVRGRSTTATCDDFFGHLSGLFRDCDMHCLTLGSDDEAAMRKSMMHYFNRASSIVCVHHLRKNVTRKLDDVLGKTSPIRHVCSMMWIVIT